VKGADLEDRKEVSEKEVETYTLVSTALKHPIRRRILRMLTKKPLTFTEIQDALKINSAHLSYHLHAMRELLNQTGDGKYLLSTFGDATLTLMHRVEETEEMRPRKRNDSIRKLWFSLPLIMLSSMLILASAYILINPPLYNVFNERYRLVEGTLGHRFYMKSDTAYDLSWDIPNGSAPFIMYIAKFDVNLTYRELKEYSRDPDFLSKHGVVTFTTPFGDHPCIFLFSGDKEGGGLGFSGLPRGDYSLVIRAEEGYINLDVSLNATDLSYDNIYRASLLLNLCFIILYSKHFSSIEDWIQKKKLVWSWKCLAVDTLSLVAIILAFQLSWISAIFGAILITIFRLVYGFPLSFTI